ncbi:hypothetical protein HYU23_03895 [Candidatus Woesearchaeota archaeon]|nr:hypothetical protein [Candidatus Woesearchaeota archaeon]
MYEIVVGRSDSDRKALGIQGSVFLGKHYVKMGNTTSLSNKVYLDVSKTHVVLVAGKRGSGKCVAGDTQIYLANKSTKKIKELIEEKFKNNKVKKDQDWEYVECDGTETLCVDISKLKIIKSIVEKFWRHKAPLLLIKIETEQGRELTCTSEHPFFIYENNKIIIKRADEIIICDKIVCTEEINQGSKIIFDEVNKIDYLLNHKEEYVYDLTVPINHNFLAGKIPIVAHNSYTLGVVAEEMAHLPTEVKNKIAVLMIDTMGIFWTMRFPNLKDEDLLDEWGLPKKPLDINIYTPAGYFQQYKEEGIPTDFPFTINPSELSSLDWCNSFNVFVTDAIGIAIESIISKIKEEKSNYSIDEIIKAIEDNKKIEQNTKLATINRFLAAKSWEIFSEESTPIKEIVSGGKVTILDISAYKDWNVKNLVTGIICKKLMEERIVARKKEELEDVKKGHSYFQTSSETTGEETPLVWILIDEAHSFIPKDKITAATEPLIHIIREGRQPGISLIMATQQPGEIHSDVITQTDIVLSHRLTARRDIDALNAMMQTYLPGAIQKYFNLLPKLRGSAILLDDTSERIYPLQIRPRFTWHGGEEPKALKPKGKAAAELGL